MAITDHSDGGASAARTSTPRLLAPPMLPARQGLEAFDELCTCQVPGATTNIPAMERLGKAWLGACSTSDAVPGSG
jgi:hypothetical protein